ncbi:transposase [Pseudoduganella umbonata]|uniref:Transposase n=1 Tax=Pseudoduganella umbonata TaxID=864828 RepID=A0A4V1EDK5_9BURK|nr:transposase [Pseudoduganella umbonata]MBB3224214.1 putative transposase [Pseudoduganella umbonata]QCP11401.1 transposase [Pseudoduganella umbonata]
MPRRARLLLPAVPLHITQRGHNRQPCFHLDDDYRAYLYCMRKNVELMDISVHAYVLMTNHVHLLISFEQPDTVGDFMKALAQHHTQYLNERLKRTGTVWEGRFKSCPVPTEKYLIICQQYVELNPVRAAMVNSVAQYPWSSYRENAGLRHDELVRPHQLYLDFGSTVQTRAEYYRGLFNNTDDRLFDDIRKATAADAIPGLPPPLRGRPRKQ